MSKLSFASFSVVRVFKAASYRERGQLWKNHRVLLHGFPTGNQMHWRGCDHITSIAEKIYCTMVSTAPLVSVGAEVARNRRIQSDLFWGKHDLSFDVEDRKSIDLKR
jgi:hypothetical protein